MAFTVAELRRKARENRIVGRSRMLKVDLEVALGVEPQVPPHLPFLELLAMEYEQFAVAAQELVGLYKGKLDTYVRPPYSDTDLTLRWRRDLRMAERDVSWACAQVALYRSQLS